MKMNKKKRKNQIHISLTITTTTTMTAPVMGIPNVPFAMNMVTQRPMVRRVEK